MSSSGPPSESTPTESGSEEHPFAWGKSLNHSARIVGVDDELDRVRALLEAARGGSTQSLLVEGEPGIGKTRLATEAARTAYQDGGTVLFGSCDEDVGLPYRPFVEALRHYVAHGSHAVLADHVRTQHGELVRLVPELRRRIEGLPAPQVAEPGAACGSP